MTRTLLALSLMASLLTLLPMSKASATTRYIYVNDDVSSVGSPPFDGTSWAHAYGDLQTALTAADAMVPSAANPVEIRVASGTYWPGFDRETSTFLLRNNVGISGGFNGYTDDPRDRRPMSPS